ncbi:hypothetical protein ACFLVS_05325, partial [Chloroflexota bacterium]
VTLVSNRLNVTTLDGLVFFYCPSNENRSMTPYISLGLFFSSAMIALLTICQSIANIVKKLLDSRYLSIHEPMKFTESTLMPLLANQVIFRGWGS